jgi:hypothetical protein
MSQCGDHFFHAACLLHLQGAANFLRCPVCNTSYGVITGDMPKGTMSYKRHPPNDIPCEGFEEYGTIMIEYKFPNG